MNTSLPGRRRDQQPGLDVLVLGRSGRVGQALAEHLDDSDDIALRTIGRYDTADPDAFDGALRAVLTDVDVVVNVAGVAHLDPDPTDADFARLVAANLSLPVLLARRCLEASVPLVHVSSSKSGTPTTPYGWSKAACDATLRTSFDRPFIEVGLPLVIVQPPALLIAPFDAGKLARLAWLDRVPDVLLPKRPVPVLRKERLVDRLEETLRDLVRSDGSRCTPTGVSTISWVRDELDNLRSIHDAMADARKNRSR